VKSADTGADLLQEAISDFGLHVDAVEPVDESYSSVVHILTLESGERLVLKIPFVERKLLRELRALQDLEGDLPVPRVVDCWRPGDGRRGALLLSLLPGQVISGAVTPDLAHDLGVLLARLHCHELDRYGDLIEATEPSLGWWAMLDRIFDTWKPHCEGVMPPVLFRKTQERYECLFAALPEPDGPNWVHFDYRPGNVLVVGTQITGLIDFESARGGSGDLDFVKIKGCVWDRWPGTKAPFLLGYASIRALPDVERTLPFYELRNAFGGIAWCVRRSGIDDPFFAENMRALQRLLAGE
jgi:Ser/Thr protein kinase RdoA (MazF antagonist)